MAAWPAHAWAPSATTGAHPEGPLRQAAFRKPACQNAQAHAGPVRRLRARSSFTAVDGASQPRSGGQRRCEAVVLGDGPQHSEDLAAACTECDLEGAEAPHAVLTRPAVGQERLHPRDVLLEGIPRRAALLSTLLAGPLLSLHLSLPAPAPAESSFLQRGLSKYIKKKRLDPLETYVPTILLTTRQLLSVKSVIEDPGSDAEAVINARYLLRTGAAASLRTDLRAVAQYAEEATEAGEGVALPGGAKPKDEAEKCLRVLIDLDLLMRTEPDSARERMLATLAEAQSILDQLLATVPEDVLQRSKAVVQAVGTTPGLANPGTEEKVKGSGEEREGEEENVKAGSIEGASEEQGAPETGDAGRGFQSKLLQRRTSEAELLEKIL